MMAAGEKQGSVTVTLPEDGSFAYNEGLDRFRAARVSKQCRPAKVRETVTAVPFFNMDRQQAHQLLDQLPPAQFTAIARLLQVLASTDAVEPLAHSLARAPIEEEEITPETAEALDRARESLACGEGIPHAEILREFALHRRTGQK